MIEIVEEYTKNISIEYPSEGPILPLILETILKLKKGENQHLFFRGEKKKYPYVIPSLYRKGNDKLILEGSEYYYRSLMSELGLDDYVENTSLVRTMAEFRHYGAITRIIDVSRNPLTSLYFAIEDAGGKEVEDGYIYIFETKNINEKFDTGHTVAIKTALNLIPQQIIDGFLSSCEALSSEFGTNATYYTTSDLLDNNREISLKLMNKKKITKAEESRYNHISRVVLFMDKLNQRARVRETLIYPFKIYKDLSMAHLFISSMNTDRIRRQRGAFIFPKYANTLEGKKTIPQIQEELQHSIFEYLYSGEDGNIITIPKGIKRRLKEELFQLGIDGGFLYSDIQHQSDTLLEVIQK